MNKDDSPFFEITDNISVLVNPTFLFNNILCCFHWDSNAFLFHIVHGF